MYSYGIVLVLLITLAATLTLTSKQASRDRNVQKNHATSIEGNV